LVRIMPALRCAADGCTLTGPPSRIAAVSAVTAAALRAVRKGSGAVVTGRDHRRDTSALMCEDLCVRSTCRDGGRCGGEEEDAAMSIEDRLRERLLKAERLFLGAAAVSEREAAEAAIERLNAKLTESARQDPPVEMKFTMPDAWSVKLFVALCRRYGLRPYRYARQRRTTVMVRRWRVLRRCDLAAIHGAARRPAGVLRGDDRAVDQRGGAWRHRRRGDRDRGAGAGMRVRTDTTVEGVRIAFQASSVSIRSIDVHAGSSDRGVATVIPGWIRSQAC
jgi:hypothetical protein